LTGFRIVFRLLLKVPTSGNNICSLATGITTEFFPGQTWARAQLTCTRRLNPPIPGMYFQVWLVVYKILYD